MRIFITCHSSRKGGGISVARNLLRAFAIAAPEHEYVVTIPPGLGYEATCREFRSCSSVTYEHRNLAERLYWEEVRLPAMVNDAKPDVIFNLGNHGFVRPAAPQATLVQDPHLFYPSSHYGRLSMREKFVLMYHRRCFRRALKRTAILFCQTSVAKARLQRAYGAGIRVELCKNALSEYIDSGGNDVREPVLLRGLPPGIRLLTLTRYYPHKNLERIADLFAKYGDVLSGVVVLLTIGEDECGASRALLNRIRRLGLENSIVTVGAVEQRHLRGFYEHTDALFLPTLLESSSGTYAEAIRFGRPILTSNYDFARVVCGEAAAYFDPMSLDSMRDAIIRFRDVESERQRLARLSKERGFVEVDSWASIGAFVMRGLEAIRQG